MRVSCLTRLTLNIQEVNVVPLHSERFVTELNAFMNSLAALAFHLTVLLNCSRVFCLLFFLPGARIVSANVSDFSCLWMTPDSLSHYSPCCSARKGLLEALLPGISMGLSKPPSRALLVFN